MENKIMILNEVIAAAERLLKASNMFQQKKEVLSFFDRANNVVALEPAIKYASNEAILIYVITETSNELEKLQALLELRIQKETLAMDNVQIALFNLYYDQMDFIGCKFVIHDAIAKYNVVLDQPVNTLPTVEEIEEDFIPKTVEALLDDHLNRSGVPKRKSVTIDDINTYLKQAGFTADEIKDGYCNFLRVSPGSIIIEKITGRL